MALRSTFRIFNVDLPKSKPVGVALTYLYGVGDFKAKAICAEFGINPITKLESLEDDMPAIKQYIARKFKPKQDYQRDIAENINHKIKIGSYQGMRHAYALPVHGQRTKSNANTQKRLGAIRARELGFQLYKKQVGDKTSTNKIVKRR